ncbi:hypothetical protein [Rhizobium sp. NXC24]|uniref:hypothetical protein n=1 Tax=Rhizobium sp. NXC24 TaxID=2048897 RepID=UPI000CDF46CD|nr:hypothetical protein [Rhizobium sp. NXC24]AVA25703.1 hypothetical protein NXC24_PC01266 [Rhizobium sp. NXC24]
MQSLTIKLRATVVLLLVAFAQAVALAHHPIPNFEDVALIGTLGMGIAVILATLVNSTQLSESPTPVHRADAGDPALPTAAIMPEVGTVAGMPPRADKEGTDTASSVNGESAFAVDIETITTAVIEGDLTARMAEGYDDPNLDRIAIAVNRMVWTIEEGVLEINRVTEALANGDLSASMRGQLRGSIGQIQRNVNLAMATIRSTLKVAGAAQFEQSASRAARMIARFKRRAALPKIAVSDGSSMPVASPARALRRKVMRAFGEPANAVLRAPKDSSKRLNGHCEVADVLARPRKATGALDEI